MKETFIFYSVSEYSDGYYNKSKPITSLTEAETIAKDNATRNREVYFINSHTLTVLKNFKIDDKPREAGFVNYCHYEGCNKEAVKDEHNGIRDYCALHTAVHMRNSKHKRYVDSDFILNVKKIPQKIGEKLLVDLVTLVQKDSSYRSHLEESHRIEIRRLNEILTNYGIRYQNFYDGKKHAILQEGANANQVHDLCYIIIEMGGVKFQ